MTIRKYMWLWALPVAVICYAMGAEKGLFLLVVLGVLFEGAFWLGLFSRAKKKG